MLRLNEVKLPLDHSEEELHAAVIERLDIELKDLLNCVVFRRSVDARKRSSIQLIYTLDVEVTDESTVFNRNEKLKKSGQVTVSPDTNYHFVTHAPQEIKQRPVVIGTGPCGFFAGLLLAQMGFKPIILERGKIVQQRTRDTMGFWRKSVFKPESNVQFGEGGAGTGRVVRWRKGQSQSQLSAVLVCQAAVRRALAARKCGDERAWEVARLRDGVFRLRASSKRCLARRRWHCLVRAAGIDSYTA